MKNMMLLAILALAFTGCGKTESSPPTQTDTTHGTTHEHEHDGHAVNGWCTEHGVPEKDCSLCNKKVADACKKNNDWCQEHDRAESQCFICHPEYAQKFIDQYKAQYGKEPPKAEN